MNEPRVPLCSGLARCHLGIESCTLVDTTLKEGDWKTKTYTYKGIKAQTSSKSLYSIVQKYLKQPNAR